MMYGKMVLLTVRCQTDGSMLISRAFYCFLPGAPLALKMSWGQRCSALLHTLSKVACVTLAIALAALPLAMFPTTRNIPIHFVTESDRLWPKRLLLASYLMFRFNRYLILRKSRPEESCIPEQE